MNGTTWPKPAESMTDGKGKIQQRTDEEIVSRILEQGDIDLFSVLYDRYANKVYRKCISITRDASISQDLCHDILVKAFLNLSKFQHKSRFSTWLYSISYNYIIDYVRKKKKLPTTDIEENEAIQLESPGDEGKQEKILFEIQLDRLGELLDEIPPDEKALILMKYQDLMSVSDIESVLGLSTSAVKMRLKRARDRIKILYKEKFPNE